MLFSGAAFHLLIQPQRTDIRTLPIDMNFNHLIEINDPLNPLIDPLTRDQLWRGLMLRATFPKLFVPWLDVCDIVHRSGDTLERELRYGDVVIRDQVTFLPQQQVQYHVPAQNDIPASRLNMTIEEPQPDMLFVRFEYDDGTPDAAGTTDAFYNDFRRSAYQESDIDTVRMIRQLCSEGRLNPHV